MYLYAKSEDSFPSNSSRLLKSAVKKLKLIKKTKRVKDLRKCRLNEYLFSGIILNIFHLLYA